MQTEKSKPSENKYKKCLLAWFIILDTVDGVNLVSVSEPEGAAEAEVVGSSISAATAGLPLGLSSFSHTSWPSTPSPGLAKVLTAVPQTARTRVWVRCTHCFIVIINDKKK